MKFHKTCTLCGHIETAYTINMNGVMLEAFITFATKYLEINHGKAPWSYTGLKKGDIGLKNSQYSNFQNLRHFGLIYQESQNRHLTPLGYRRYNGQEKIRNPAGFMAGETLSENHEARITHAPREQIFMGDLQKPLQDQKEKYQNEATKARSVF